MVRCSEKQNISAYTIALAFYFAMMPFDLFEVWNMGSLLKVFAFVPLVFLLVDIRMHERPLDIKLIVFAIMYMAYCVGSVLYSVHQGISVDRIRTLLLNYSLFILLGSIPCLNDREIEFLKKALAFAGVFTIILTFANTGYTEWDNRMTLEINGEQADNNYINGYVAFLFSYSIERLVKDKKMIFIVPILAGFVFIFYTGSRGALLGFVAALAMMLLYYVAKSNSTKKAFIIILIIIMAAVLVVGYFVTMNLLPETVSKRFTLQSVEDSGGSGRVEIWKAMFKSFRDAGLMRKLFGHGYRTSPLLNSYNGLVAHNVFIDALINVGVFGTAILVLMYGSFIKAAFKSKDMFIIGCMTCYFIMSMSLSLSAYKPMFNTFIMILLITRKNKYSNDIRYSAPGYLSDAGDTGTAVGDET